MRLSVGDGDPAADRHALAERRRTSPSLFPPRGAAPARAPFAWLLAGDASVEDVLYGPDWAW